MGNWLKIGVLVAICLVPLFTIPVFGQIDTQLSKYGIDVFTDKTKYEIGSTVEIGIRIDPDRYKSTQDIELQIWETTHTKHQLKVSPQETFTFEYSVDESFIGEVKVYATVPTQGGFFKDEYFFFVGIPNPIFDDFSHQRSFGVNYYEQESNPEDYIPFGEGDTEEMSEVEKQAREEIPNPCINIREPKPSTEYQGDIGLNDPAYMEAFREAQYQYQQQLQHCLREYQNLSYSDDIEPLLDKGYALANEKKYAEALEQFDKVLEMTDHEIVQGKVFLEKGVIYSNMDEYETAIQYYDKVLEIEPGHAQILLYKGILYQETKQWQKSIDMFEQILDYPGEDVPGYIAYSQERLDANKKFEERGGCLIATATFGSELAPQVQMLREIRDNSLLQTQSGQSFMQGFNLFYYSFSPAIADYERQNPVFKEAVKLAITPLITSLSILNYVEIDSEAEMLSYGISLILLNVGMYFVAPAIVIVKLRRQVLH